MLPRLRLRKTRRRLTHDSKGFSSIVGAVFAALVMFSLISTVFVWSLSQNTQYNNAVKQSTQADLDRSNERIISNVSAWYDPGNKVKINGTLQNGGSMSVQLVTLWVTDATQKTYTSNSLTNYILKPGDVITYSDSTVPDGLYVDLPNLPDDELTCWYITARGNTIAAKSFTTTNIIQEGDQGDTTYADVASGIGLLGFNFKEFSKHDFGVSLPANHTLLPTFQKDYWLRQDHYTMFHAILTNYDPDKKDMVLNGSSVIYALIVQAGTVKFGFWPIVNVTGNAQTGLYVHPIGNNLDVQYILHYSTPVEVYFLGPYDPKNKVYSTPAVSSALTPLVYPLNIMAFGKLGTDDYGQNVPFVSLNVLS